MSGRVIGTNARVEFILYEGAPHAFFSDDPPRVGKKGASEGRLNALRRLLRKHLEA